MDAPATESLPHALASRRRLSDRFGDTALRSITAVAAFGSLALIGLIAYVLVSKAWLSLSTFGGSFLWHRTWDPVAGHFGALNFIFGTLLVSGLAILVAAPISIAIGLFLSELAPRGVRTVVGSLVETLAAVPSVVIGLWGILVLGPFIEHELGPALKSVFGFLPFFDGTPRNFGVLPAVIVLTIMVVPITASISRELFLSVPRDLKEGALGLGLTRWEMSAA